MFPMALEGPEGKPAHPPLYLPSCHTQHPMPSGQGCVLGSQPDANSRWNRTHVPSQGGLCRRLRRWDGLAGKASLSRTAGSGTPPGRAGARHCEWAPGVATAEADKQDYMRDEVSTEGARRGHVSNEPCSH